MEMTNKELHSTPEFRRQITSLALIQLAGILLFGLLMLYQQNRYSRDLENRIMSAAGVIERLYPDSFTEAVPLLLKSGTDTGRTDNSEILLKWGYSAGTETALYGVPGFAAAAAVMLLMNILIPRRQLKRLFGRIRKLTSAAASALEGRPVRVQEEYRDGVLDGFISRFNQMVRKFQSNSDILKKQKVFMENVISDISHQLKTPMASLIMYNDLMLRDPSMEDRTRREFLDVSRSQLSRMEWLVKSLLKMARLESGTIVFEEAQIDIADPVQKAVDLLSHLGKERTISVTDRREHRIMIMGDSDWLAEAFANILKNAIEHTADDGRIMIWIDRTALYQRICIEDDGPGIPEEDRSKIFRKFFRGDSSVGMENVGIGLPLSRTILSAHGADIRAEQRKAGGACFIITLPY